MFVESYGDTYMGKRRHHHHHHSAARFIVFAVLAVVFFPVLARVAMGVLAVAVAVPLVILGLGIAALSLAFVAVLLGGPVYLLFRLFFAGRHQRQAEYDEPRAQPRVQGPVSLAPDALLRRRYVAGELTYQQFQAGMTDVLKERFQRGELGVSEYEAELDKLLEPARRVDTRIDPAVAGSLRR